MRRPGHAPQVVAAALGWGVSAITVSARADPGRATLRIECPTLGGEARAALEARGEAELVAQPSLTGEVVVHCENGDAVLRFAPPDGALRERRVALGTDGVDEILVAIHALVFDARRTAPPVSAAPAVQPNPAPAPPPAAPPASTSVRRGLRVGALAALNAELWRGGIPAVLGVAGGVAVSPWEAWSVRLRVAPEWGLGTSSGIRAWALRAELGVAWTARDWLAVEAGTSARSLWVNATGTTVAQLQTATGGVFVAARGRVSLGAASFEVGPRVDWLFAPVVVDRGSSEVFRVPAVVPGLEVEAVVPGL
jgi:hypothetical protein